MVTINLMPNAEEPHKEFIHRLCIFTTPEGRIFSDALKAHKFSLHRTSLPFYVFLSLSK